MTSLPPFIDTSSITPFMLFRKKDVTGVSGDGFVAHGVRFPDGMCVLRWVTTPRSVGIYNSFQDLIEIHGHGQNTEIIWGK